MPLGVLLNRMPRTGKAGAGGAALLGAQRYGKAGIARMDWWEWLRMARHGRYGV